MNPAGAARVSFIMPVWQPHPPWLRTAIASVLNQQNCDVELIVVDDGCRVPVAALLRGISDPRIRMVRALHGGAAAARNAGFAAATGEWVRFADADDVLVADSTSRLMSIAWPQRTIAYGATLVCDEHLTPRRMIASRRDGDLTGACVTGRFDVRHPSILFPRHVVEAAGPWDERLVVGEDWDFVLRTLEHAPAGGDQAVATLYRRHRGSLTGMADIRAGEDARRLIVSRYFARHPELRGSPLEREAWCAVHIERARNRLDRRHYTAALANLMAATWADPRHGVSEGARLLGQRLRSRLARIRVATHAGEDGESSPAQRAQSPVICMPASSGKAGE